jgi:HD-GYP domain-containing protein (c-di-GMP phosphodiesterase class II)
MQQHSEIGYELLKNKGLNENTLNLIKYHHQTPSGNGYPQIKDEFDYNISSQILNAADKYCALREERSYKPPLSREDALDIIRQDVQSGVISPEVYDALQVGSENFELSKT